MNRTIYLEMIKRLINFEEIRKESDGTFVWVETDGFGLVKRFSDKLTPAEVEIYIAALRD